MFCLCWYVFKTHPIKVHDKYTNWLQGDGVNPSTCLGQFSSGACKAFLIIHVKVDLILCAHSLQGKKTADFATLRYW